MTKKIFRLSLKPGLIVPVLLAVAAMVPASSAIAAGNVERVALATAEQRLEDTVQGLWTNNPMALAGAARGVYVQGVGVVLTAEVNLATAQISLMHPSLSEQEQVQLHQTKVSRLPQLKEALKQTLKTVVGDLSAVPDSEKIMIAVILPRYSWEDAAGLPMQVTLQATKAELMAGGAIETSEF